jgi:hypothetical protein
MPSGLSQHEKALAWARSNVGKHEEPWGSNNGPFVRSVQAASWLAPPKPGKKGWPWCVATWLKAWKVAGRVMPYLGAGAYSTLDWYRKHLPLWVVPLEKAKPGAAVIINTGAGHLAILNKPWSKGQKYVNTVNGNVHDSMDYTEWPASLVRGVVDPPEKQVGIVKPAKQPRYEIVTSESGHTVLIVSARPWKQLEKFLPKVRRNHVQFTIRRRKET